MINPTTKPNWRPTVDMKRRYSLDPELALTEVYQPKDRSDALAYVREMALSSIVAYDGFPDVQTELIAEEAEAMYPSLFGVELEVVTETQAPTGNVLDLNTRPDGSIDWNAVSRQTIHVVSRTQL